MTITTMKTSAALMFAAALALSPTARAVDHAEHDHGSGATAEHDHDAAGHDHESAEAAEREQGAGGHDHGSGDGGHDMDMHKKHVKEMQDRLDRIKSASDPQEKERLVQEFVDSEQEHMKQMHGMMDKTKDKDSGRSDAKASAMKRMRMGMTKGGSDTVERRLDAIEKKLDAVLRSLDKAPR